MNILADVENGEVVNLLRRLSTAIVEGKTTPEKVNAYYREKWLPRYQNLVNLFTNGELFVTQKKTFEQWIMHDRQGEKADLQRFDEIWHAAWMCGEKLPSPISDYFSLRLERSLFTVYGRRVGRKDIEDMAQADQDRIRRVWIQQANERGWDWSRT